MRAATGHADYLIHHRDGGDSVALTGGRSLWLFGDTITGGQFLNNTAALSLPGKPLDLLEPADTHQFIPQSDYLTDTTSPCYEPGTVKTVKRDLIWPIGAVKLPASVSRPVLRLSSTTCHCMPEREQAVAIRGMGVDRRRQVGLLSPRRTPDLKRGRLQAARQNDHLFDLYRHPRSSTNHRLPAIPGLREGFDFCNQRSYVYMFVCEGRDRSARARERRLPARAQPPQRAVRPDACQLEERGAGDINQTWSDPQP